MDGLSTLLMQVFGVGGFEWIFIILIVIVFIFGVKKIPELAKSFGKASAEYQKARIESKREIQQITNQDRKNQDTNIGREKLEAIAETLGIDYTNKNDDELRAAIEVEIDKSKNKI